MLARFFCGNKLLALRLLLLDLTSRLPLSTLEVFMQSSSSKFTGLGTGEASKLELQLPLSLERQSTATKTRFGEGDLQNGSFLLTLISFEI